ncbi:MAG: Smr/MutS family protein [Roseivirga sp.]
MGHQEELHIGDHVKMRGQASVGEVVQIVGKQAFVAFETLELRVPLSQLEKIRQDTLPPSTALSTPRLLQVSSETFSAFNPEIDLHGLSVEEALSAVDQWIDQAVLVGYKDLKIIHGKGTGALRNAVRTYLQSHVQIKQVIAQHPYPGGEGVTWVEMK